MKVVTTATVDADLLEADDGNHNQNDDHNAGADEKAGKESAVTAKIVEQHVAPVRHEVSAAVTRVSR